ncbi:MAG: VOC family protein [Pseudomonadales bacterium]|nr:VOC family protein [Pseudomonadales bacterium]
MRQLLFIMLCLLVAPGYAQLAQPDEAGISYGHMHLNVADVAQHKQLWQEYFGGVPVGDGALQAIRFPNTLILFTERQPGGGSRESVLHHFGFKVRNMDRFLAHWRASGLPVGEVFTGAEGQRNVYVTMPDEVYVELQEDKSLATEISGYHIHYFTPQYEELLAWYVDIFSLEQRPRGTIPSTTNVPGMNLSFGDAREERLPTRRRAIDHIGFEIVGLEEFCRRLEQKGISFDVPYREIPSLGLKIAFLTDPSGVTIELTEGLARF